MTTGEPDGHVTPEESQPPGESERSERLRILRLVQQGKVTAEEADQLFQALAADTERDGDGDGDGNGDGDSDGDGDGDGDGGRAARPAGGGRDQSAADRPVDWEQRLEDWAEEFGERMGEFGERMGRMGEALGDQLSRWFTGRVGGYPDGEDDASDGDFAPGGGVTQDVDDPLPWHVKEGSFAAAARLDGWVQGGAAQPCPTICLKVSNDNGSIEVVPSAAETYRLELTYKPRWAGLARHVRRPTVEYQEDEGRGFDLKVRGYGGGSVRVRLHLPTAWLYELDLHSMNGSVSVSDLMLSVAQIKAMNGSAGLTGGEAQEVTVESMNGSAGAQGVRARTIRVRSLNGSAHARGIWARQAVITSQNGSAACEVGFPTPGMAAAAAVAEPVAEVGQRLRQLWGTEGTSLAGAEYEVTTANGSCRVTLGPLAAQEQEWLVEASAPGGSVHLGVPGLEILHDERSHTGRKVVALIRPVGSVKAGERGATPATLKARSRNGSVHVS